MSNVNKGKEFGKRMRRLRRERGLNLAEVADAIGSSIVFVSRVERGIEENPDPYLILELEIFLQKEVKTS